ncbi:MAG: hypothetical protein GF384_05190 [Elusimicrobia bacterium]|nr:hypothetical protein [Elusimicrobiota bacterium]MBD3412186.1 hypothetical protein [Elusimicrobiota bacterium]
MIKRLAVFSLVSLVVTALWAQNRWVDINAEFTAGTIMNKLKDGWRADDAGDPSGVNKEFSYQQGVSSGTPNGWRGEAQELLNLNIAAQPFRSLNVELGYEFVGNAAEPYWQPISDQRRMELKGTKVKWIRGLAEYRRPLLAIKGFKGAGYASWADTDQDMFGFLPEQYENDRYRRLSGRIVPEGIMVETGNQTTGRVTYMTGEELVWGFGPSHYAKYNRVFGRFNTTLFYRRIDIPYGEEDENLSTWQLATRFKLSGTRRKTASQLRLGILYQPFRVDESYQYVEDAAPGTGDLGSSYRVKTGMTDDNDAFGYAAKLIMYPPVDIVDRCDIGYRHLGLVAGNKDEVTVSAERKFLSYFSSRIGYVYTKPIRGPVPLLTDQAGAIIASPRGENAPFRVTEDPQDAPEWGNREKNVFDILFVFDPTPRTWLFRWKENIVADWNINPAEDSRYASALHVKFLEYLGSSDRTPYYDEQGELTFVPAHLTGLPPTRGYLPMVEFMQVLNLPHEYRCMLLLGGGQSSASTILADQKGRTSNNYFLSSLSVRKGPVMATLRYERDTWGPEDFHRDFGQIIDRLFRAKLGYDFTDWSFAHIEYIYARRIEDLTTVSSLGSFDELRIMGGFRFGVRAIFDQHKEPIAYGELREQSAPRVSVVPDQYIFSPDGDGIQDEASFRLEVIASSIDSWTATIIDDAGQVVKIYSGKGNPPLKLIWDGVDQNFNATVGEGAYTVFFRVTDTRQRTSIARPVEIKVQY